MGKFQLIQQTTFTCDTVRTVFFNITLKKFWNTVSILKGTFSAVSAALTGAPVVGVAAIAVAVGAVGPAG